MTSKAICVLCHKVIESAPVVAQDGSGKTCCGSCYGAILKRLDGLKRLDDRASTRCPGCGAELGQGCDCRENRLAITRGERRKAALED